MKKFELNLESYEVEGIDDGDYPLKDNLAALLRAPGIFKTGEEIAEAVVLAKQILAVGNDVLTIDEHEATILKFCLNRHISLTHEGKNNFGGPFHEECILRVFEMSEIRNAKGNEST